ncbi:RNA polymerase sigma-70 factor [Pedobacter sp. HMWF019]|uniref:RNA polymerase sigma-70 factor n=1 Tax=Pedobacter sp. HMWF019 TaxID=2056856 RepID=UPI000D372831|nr:RNA polymerase sigma-70 factor [Pedobacter sp. HMWF019]PTT01409.1 RNA polymerase sigma-70 factor [Pedobacter sp. HMWF019]
MLEQKVYADHELIALLKANNQVGLKNIYEKYWKRLYLSAYSVLKDSDQAQDIVQEVLLQLWIRKNEADIEKLSAYLFTAVRYKVLSYIRSADHRKVFIEDGDLEQLAGRQEPHNNLELNDINKVLELGISALPERCRQVFILSRKELLSNKEIAERLGITVKAVESQMTIALKQLRAKMGDFFFLVLIITPLVSMIKK